jgi:predicted nucleic acid-binding protein
MLEVFSVLFIDQKIADMAIEIRKKQRIKLPDAIIAATAKVLNLCLVTRNIDDFKKIEIQIANPFD